MSPPPASRHSRRQARIAAVFAQLLPQGVAFTECAISTADGVKAADVAWLAHERPEIHEDPVLFTRAPEICVEILSPSNTPAEIDEKRALFFDAGATEVWIWNLDGSVSFFSGADHQISASLLCPAFQTGFLDLGLPYSARGLWSRGPDRRSLKPLPEPRAHSG